MVGNLVFRSKDWYPLFDWHFEGLFMSGYVYLIHRKSNGDIEIWQRLPRNGEKKKVW